MKVVLILLVLGGVAYAGYSSIQARNPEAIEHPVYAEIRLDASISGRDLNLVLFGEMASDEDCRERANRVWEKTIEGCTGCTMKTTVCKADLEPRYRRLFEDASIHSTYLSFTRGSRYERNGRMVIYGLTSDEGDAMCEITKAEFEKKYEGAVHCVHGRR
jgi:hypothetical protein